MAHQQQVDYTIQVTLKENFGKFGIKRGRLHEFRFCAALRSEAIKMAALNVPSRGLPFDEREIRVIGALPVLIDKAERAGGHNDRQRTNRPS